MAERPGSLEDLGLGTMFGGVYSGKRVLITGHTGFKGSWLAAWLLELGAQVAGYSLGIPTEPANFEVLGLAGRLRDFRGDIRDGKAFCRAVTDFAPETVFHLAAQSLVRRSYAEPVETVETNTLGTLNVLAALRETNSVKVAVIITSDKCYRNVEWTWGYREIDPLGGEDPYSASKACAELLCYAYQQSYFHQGPLRMATARAGNVIGGGDWARDRLVPDCVRAWAAGQRVKIRYPQATRPWQHVLEPLSGYLWLGARLWQGAGAARGDAFNFGPAPTVNQTVGEVLAAMARHWPQAAWEAEAPEAQQPEATSLKLCCDKALNLLEWRAILPLAEAIRFTAEWYRTFYDQGANPMLDLTRNQIQEYVQRARVEGLPWAR